VVAWALPQDSVARASVIRLDFQILTKVLTPGDYGNRITAWYGLTSEPPVCCYSDRWPIFPNGTVVTGIEADCCYAGPFVDLMTRRVIDANAVDSGTRVTKIFDKTVTGYADDNLWHDYTITLNRDADTTNWNFDNGTVNATGPYSFVPSYIVFWAQAHDIGDSVTVILKSIRQTTADCTAVEPSACNAIKYQVLSEPQFLALAPWSTTGSSGGGGIVQPTVIQKFVMTIPWYGQWWFTIVWGLIGVGAGALLFTNVPALRMRMRNEGIILPAQGQASVACPACGGFMAPTSTFCGNCGSKLREAKVICPGCSCQMHLNAVFCGICGTRLKDNATAPKTL